MFTPNCRPILIGSLPLTSHQHALQLILDHTPEIPLWPQLPKNPREGMLRQFLTGFPGLVDDGNRFWIDSAGPGFAEEMTAFYEEYLRVADDPNLLRTSRFALDPDSATGFFTLIDYLRTRKIWPLTVKGQITGAVTTGIGVKDGHGHSIFYDDNLRDMLVKLVAMRGCWQVEEMRPFTALVPPIVFIDEPGLVGFGAGGFAGVSREMAALATAEVVTAIKGAGGLAGLHICANGDWGPALTSAADIISFDAYFYFDNFILYREQLIAFLKRHGILAWGIVPTGDPLAVAAESVDSLFGKWLGQVKTLAAFGFGEKQLMAQTLIAPSCGTGSLTPELARKVLAMTSQLSAMARTHLFCQ
jgi:hypothetical protein